MTKEPLHSESSKRSSRLTDSVHLYGSKLLIARGIMIIAMAISAFFYLYGVIHYKAVLDLGFIGAICKRCDRPMNGLSLIVLPRGPAERVGIQTGDLLIQVDGKQINTAPLPTGIDEPWGFFGPPGSSVSVTVKKGGLVRTFDVKREKGWNENATLGFRILNISEVTSNFLALFVEITIIVFFFSSGLFLCLSKSNELIVILTGVTVALAGFIFTRSLTYFPSSAIKYIYVSSINVALPTLFLFFPNGKLASRRDSIFIISYLGWQLFFELNIIPHDYFTFNRYVDVAYWFYVIGSLSFRYRNKFTQEQVQQTKWVYTSLLIIFLAGIIFIFTFSIFFSPESSNVRSNLINSLGFTSIRLISILLPISIILAIRRYDLWQVDVVLNRIEIASLLGIIIGTAFIVLVAVVKELADTIFGAQSALIATTISTIVITYLFEPIQKKIGALINRRFYSVKLDLLENFIEVEPDAWQLIPLPHLLNKALRRICKVFQNQWGAVLLVENGNYIYENTYKIAKEELNAGFITDFRLAKLRRGELVTLTESESKFSLLVPLFLPDLDQHELQAIVCLGSREKNRGYSSDDKKALREFGEKVGIAIYILRN